MDLTILVTGSSGYLGSALCVALAKHCRVVAIDKRPPSTSLCCSAPEVQWHVLDIADKSRLHGVFKQNIALKQPIDIVLHFAAFYHYGRDWRYDYDSTNLEGTRNVMAAACCWGVRRVIFASSIGALKPPPEGTHLKETSLEMVDLPYNKSKAMGEAIVTASNRLTAAVVLRIGGVFSDWCELPPLYSLIKLWSRKGSLGRCMPGRGKSGFPHIHRKDLVRIVLKIIGADERLDAFETFFCAPDGHTSHQNLFPVIRQCSGRVGPTRPIHVPPCLLTLPMNILYLWNRLHQRETYERSWMLAYVDRPLSIDASYTRARLQWSPEPELSILNRLPVLMRNFRQAPDLWESRNLRRNQALYEFHPDDHTAA